MDSDKRQALLGGMPKDDIPAFLLKVGIYALQKQGGYVPQQGEFEDEPITKSVLACDDSYEAEQVLQRVFEQVFQQVYIETGVKYYLSFTDDFLTGKYIELMDALVKSPHRFMRDILEAEYNLPLLRRNMTIEQKKVADVLEARFKEDERLRLEGKTLCHFTGVIVTVTDERQARDKTAQRQTQAEMNAAFRK